MGNHATEEHGVEPGEDTVKPGNQTPRHGEKHITGVVDLASEAIPSVTQDLVVLARLDDLGVLDRLPRNLGEGVALDKFAALHGAEAVLLPVAAVPDPVDEDVASEEQHQGEAVPAVGCGVMAGQVQGRVAVRERDTGHVPEDKHEAPFLVVHVPGGHDELLALGAGVGVEIVRKPHEADLAGDIAVALVLARRGSAGQEEQDVPGQTDLEEHLEVEDAEHARVQLGAHEEVVNVVA